MRRAGPIIKKGYKPRSFAILRSSAGSSVMMPSTSDSSESQRIRRSSLMVQAMTRSTDPAARAAMALSTFHRKSGHDCTPSPTAILRTPSRFTSRRTRGNGHQESKYTCTDDPRLNFGIISIKGNFPLSAGQRTLDQGDFHHAT